MQLIERTAVEIAPDRQRQEFDGQKLAALAASILSKGLMHPIVLENNGIRLLAGERRLRAIQKLADMGHSNYPYNGRDIPITQIPYTLLKDLSPDILFEAELEENLYAENLSWQELVQARSKLHKMRKGENPSQTNLETANEILSKKNLGGPAPTENQIRNEASNVEDSVLLEAYLGDPDVGRAESKREALRVVRRKLAGEFASAITASAAREAESAPADQRFTIHAGSCLDILPGLAPGSFDLILTDPPYGIGADSFVGIDKQLAHSYDDSRENFQSLMLKFLPLAQRALRKTGWMILFYDFRNFDILSEILEYQCPELEVHHRPGIWAKGSPAMTDATKHLLPTYEPFLVCRMPQAIISKASVDVLTFPAVKDKVHAAQKPVDLYYHLVKTFCVPGSNILDAFAGSGPIFPAAARHMCTATGIELDPNHIATCKAQIGQLLGK